MDSKGLLTGVLEVIRDPQALRDAFLPGSEELLEKSRFRRSISRHMRRHLGPLLEWGVLSRSSQQRVVLPAFTVEKSSGGLRLVCDGRKLNALMQPPPSMLLPSIRSVVRRFLSANFVVQADGKSWFYQFPLADGVRDYFGVNFADARGEYTPAVLNKLCMGWSWAPCIAQRSGWVLLPEEDGLPWVDNFFVVGASEADAAEKYARFLARAELVGAELNSGSEFGSPESRFVALGLEFDLQAVPHRYRSEPAWVDKFLVSSALSAVMENRATAREFYKALGGMIWFLYSTDRKLCYFSSSLSFLRRSASVLATSPVQWDLHLPITPSVLHEFSAIVETIRSNLWIIDDVSLRPPVVGWSDASDSEWAALLELDPEPVLQGMFDEPEAHHIYVKELFAAWQAVRLAAGSCRGCSLDLQVDNAAAVAAINKGHSKNYFANNLLCAMFDDAKAADISVGAQWVSTLDQRADEFTRGTRAPAGSPRVPPVPDRHAAVAALSSGV